MPSTHSWLRVLSPSPCCTNDRKVPLPKHGTQVPTQFDHSLLSVYILFLAHSLSALNISPVLEYTPLSSSVPLHWFFSLLGIHPLLPSLAQRIPWTVYSKQVGGVSGWTNESVRAICQLEFTFFPAWHVSSPKDRSEFLCLVASWAPPPTPFQQQTIKELKRKFIYFYHFDSFQKIEVQLICNVILVSIFYSI